MIQSKMLPIRLRYGAGIGAQLVGVLATAGFSYYIWRSGISGLSAVIWFSFAAIVAVFCLTFGDTQFQAEPPRVVRQWRFLGVIPFWSRVYSLNTFREVQCRYCRGATPEDGVWMVGLVERSGRFLAVQWFCAGSDNSCPEANCFALELADITGLPLVGTGVVESAKPV